MESCGEHWKPFSEAKMRAAIYLLLIPVSGLAQQSTSTDCYKLGATVHCDSRPQATGGVLGALGGVFQGMAADQARRDQQEATTRQLAALQQQANYLRQLQFYDSLRTVNAQIERIQAQAARDSALLKVFVPRAQYVMSVALDSVQLWDTTASRFWGDMAERMVDLFAVDPEASNAKMRDVVTPVLSEYKAKKTAFIDRAKHVLSGIEDSVHMPKAYGDTLRRAGAPILNALMGRDIGATEQQMKDELWVVTEATRRKAIINSHRDVPPKKRPPTP